MRKISNLTKDVANKTSVGVLKITKFHIQCVKDFIRKKQKYAGFISDDKAIRYACKKLLDCGGLKPRRKDYV